MKKLIIIIAICLIPISWIATNALGEVCSNSSSSLSVDGSLVSTTRPSEPSMSVGATTVSVPARTSTNSTVTDCGTLSDDDTKYVLQNSVTADATCFEVTAEQITIDLNGYTITYNNSGSNAEARGINFDQYGQDDIAVVNGTITEGAGTCTGTSRNDCAPIYIKQSTDIELGGLTITWTSDYTNGISIVSGNSAAIHDNTINDNGTGITDQQRQQGQAAIWINASNSSACEIYNNDINNYRHRGIHISGTVHTQSVHDNDLSGDSYATNSTGINVHGEIYDNKVIGLGEHPIGIWLQHDAVIHGNYVYVKCTRCGTEYSDPTGAIGMRTTWGTDEVYVYDNDIIAEADDDSIASCGNGDAEARGIAIGLLDDPDDMTSGEYQDAYIYNNYIEAYNVDGNSASGTRMAAIRVAVHGLCEDHPSVSGCDGGSGGNGNVPNLWVYNNTLVSNMNTVVCADDYGFSSSPGYFYGNIIYKKESNAAFYAFGYDLGGANYDCKILSIDNDCQNGADCESDINFSFAGSGDQELIIGHHIHVLPKDSGGRIINAASVTIVESDDDSVYPISKGTGNSDCSYFDGFIIEKRFSNVEGSGPTYEVSETPNGVTVSYGSTNCDEISVTATENTELSVTLSNESNACGNSGVSIQ